MRSCAFGVSVTGPRHLDLTEPNQDAMGLNGWRGGWLASVADGLGSRPRSAVGSRRACQVTRRVLRSYPHGNPLSGALRSIHEQWLEEIAPTLPDAAATTLLLASVTAQGDVRAAQMGDGLLLMRCAGEFHCITPERAGFGNQTWALESEHRPDRWATAEGRFTQPGDGVLLSSDGVADDLDSKHLPDFLEALYQDLAGRSRRNGRRWLRAELEDWATPMHSDDKTLVAVFRT